MLTYHKVVFPERSRDVSSDRSPNDGGSEFFRLFRRRLRLVTLPSALVLTPPHSPIGLSLSQPVLSFQLSPSVALYIATNTSRSGLVVITVTCILAEIVSELAVIFADPSATAVTSPLKLTVATEVSLLAQATVAPDMISLFSS